MAPWSHVVDAVIHHQTTTPHPLWTEAARSVTFLRLMTESLPGNFPLGKGANLSKVMPLPQRQPIPNNWLTKVWAPFLKSWIC